MSSKYKKVDYGDVRDGAPNGSGTLLAKLGFNDADRSDERHDLGCAYVVEHAAALAKAVLPPTGPNDEMRLEGEPSLRASAATEVVLTTRTGFTVGFIDVVLNPQLTARISDRRFNNGTREYEWSAFRECGFGCAPIIVEVKIAPVSVGALTRQLKLYHEHFTTRGMRMHYGHPVGEPGEALLAAALAYPISAVESRALEREGIAVFRLGKKFDEWCASQKKLSVATREL